MVRLKSADRAGPWTEAFNFAAVDKAPVIFVCENNGWAISMPVDKQAATPTLAQRGVARAGTTGAGRAEASGPSPPVCSAVTTASPPPNQYGARCGPARAAAGLDGRDLAGLEVRS